MPEAVFITRKLSDGVLVAQICADELISVLFYTQREAREFLKHHAGEMISFEDAARLLDEITSSELPLGSLDDETRTWKEMGLLDPKQGSAVVHILIMPIGYLDYNPNLN